MKRYLLIACLLLFTNYAMADCKELIDKMDDGTSIRLALKCINDKTEAKQSRNHELQLGTVVISVLDFTQFSREMDNNINGNFSPSTSQWAPADGRDVTGSAYQKNFNHILPDFRGQFIRGLNEIHAQGAPLSYTNGKDGGSRQAINKYSYQHQATAVPQENSFVTQSAALKDKHISHIHGGNYKSSHHENNDKTRVVPDSGWTAFVESGEGGDGGNQYGVRVNSETATTNLSQSVIGGDEETRPQNIGVYYYIKIN